MNTSASLPTVDIGIDGMTCASCSGAVTSAISELPGVADVNVNLLGHSATFTTHHADIAPAVMSAVGDVGYTAEVVSVEPLQAPRPPKKAISSAASKEGPLRVELSVDGMTCASCVATVTRLLSELPGCSEVSVNLLG